MSAPPQPSRSLRILLRISLLTILSALVAQGILWGIYESRSAARLRETRENLRQIGIAMNAYEEKHGQWIVPKLPQDTGSVNPDAVEV